MLIRLNLAILILANLLQDVRGNVALSSIPQECLEFLSATFGLDLSQLSLNQNRKSDIVENPVSPNRIAKNFFDFGKLLLP